MFKYILNRLTERSTWLGLLALATACGATIEQALADQIIAAGMAAAGLIGIVTKDRKKEPNDAMELARMCARAADDAKAENVRVYDLRGMSSLTDFMVVCTGLSVPHLRAVIRELEEAVREKAGALPTYVEDTPVALWSVVDYIDVMVHIMGQETREFYGMDTLWKDAPVVEY